MTHELEKLQPAPEFVLMPREATRAMTMAGCDMLPSCEHVFGHAGEMLRNAYRKMVEAAALAAMPDRYTVDDPWSRPATPSGTQGALALYLDAVEPFEGRLQINISFDELSVLRRLIAAAAAAGEERKALEKIIQRLSGPSSAQLWDIRQIAEGALAATPAVGGEVRDIGNYVQHHQDCDVFDKLKRTCTCGLSEVLAAQPASPLRGNVCCYCDAPLSCARCGMEQPDDTASPLRADAQSLADFICETQDRLGPGCDELAIAQAILRIFRVRTASPPEQPAAAPVPTITDEMVLAGAKAANPFAFEMEEGKYVLEHSLREALLIEVRQILIAALSTQKETM